MRESSVWISWSRANRINMRFQRCVSKEGRWPASIRSSATAASTCRAHTQPERWSSKADYMSQLGMEKKGAYKPYDTALSVPEPKQQNRKMCLNLAAVPVTKPRHTHTSSTNQFVWLWRSFLGFGISERERERARQAEAGRERPRLSRPDRRMDGCLSPSCPLRISQCRPSDVPASPAQYLMGLLTTESLPLLLLPVCLSSHPVSLFPPSPPSIFPLTVP